jgi:hypothetical protein
VIDFLITTINLLQQTFMATNTSNSIFFFMIEELSLTMLVVANRELATFPPSTEIKV